MSDINIFDVLDVLSEIGIKRTDSRFHELGFKVLDQLGESKHVGTYKDPTPDMDAMASAAYSMVPDMRVRQSQAHQKAQANLQRLIDTFKQSFAYRIKYMKSAKPHMQKLLVKDMKDELRKLYYKAFEFGLQGSAATLSPLQTFTPDQRRWIDSAWSHELRYFNEFMDTVLSNNVYSDARIDQRAKAYMDALRSVYEAARTLAAHPLSLFHWIMRDAEHCSGCLFLRDHSPYTKDNLPTTPRAGGTNCLSNCQCYIRVVVVNDPEIIRQVTLHGYAKSSLIRMMNSLKNRR